MGTLRTLAFALVLSSLACRQTQSEPAPLNGGETIRYFSTRESASITFTFDKTPSGFIIKTSSPAYKDMRVGPDLRQGRTPIKVFGIGTLWLPPSERVVGAVNRFGTVIELRETTDGTFCLLSERNGQIRRFYDLETGFLRYIGEPYKPIVAIKESTIPGLHP